MSATEEFRQARDFLLAHRTDYAAAYRTLLDLFSTQVLFVTALREH